VLRINRFFDIGVGSRGTSRCLVRSAFRCRVLQGLAQSSDDRGDVARADIAASAGARRTLQRSFDIDLSAIQVHECPRADRLTRSLRADAFAAGPHLFFRAGAYRPQTEPGLWLLAHEVTHSIQQAQGAVRQTTPASVSEVLAEGLGQVAMAEGQHGEAHARHAESLRLLDGIGDRPGIADSLESFAALAARLSKPEAALQLAGAAVALRETIGVPQSPLRRDLLERWLSTVQLDVGEEVSARNWAIGQAMTIEQAISLALTTYQSVALLSQPQKEVSARVAGLTAREAEVLRLVARGQSNKEIAAELVLSVRTVERHITNLYGKIDARGKADATAYAFKHGLL
jgi:DNA-binding CsgD family transcriptional regulator